MSHPLPDSAVIAANVRAALSEDVGEGDISAALIPEANQAHARVITREPGIWCGSAWVTEAMRQVDLTCRVEWHVSDGEAIIADQTLFEVTGCARSILTAERTMLNFAQLLSGTATLVHQYAQAIAHTDCKLLDTRKTIPGLRLAQKYAVLCGGGHNHRIGLFDAYLLKENHIAAEGSITRAVNRAHELNPDVTLEVEVENFEQLREAIQAGADVVMLDNFSLADTALAVEQTNGGAKLEASGNVDEESITALAETGVDYISVGLLTKQVMPLDLSMRFI